MPQIRSYGLASTSAVPRVASSCASSSAFWVNFARDAGLHDASRARASTPRRRSPSPCGRAPCAGADESAARICCATAASPNSIALPCIMNCSAQVNVDAVDRERARVPLRERRLLREEEREFAHGVILYTIGGRRARTASASADPRGRMGRARPPNSDDHVLVLDRRHRRRCPTARCCPCRRTTGRGSRRAARAAPPRRDLRIRAAGAGEHVVAADHREQLVDRDVPGPAATRSPRPPASRSITRARAGAVRVAVARASSSALSIAAIAASASRGLAESRADRAQRRP